MKKKTLSFSEVQEVQVNAFATERGISFSEAVRWLINDSFEQRHNFMRFVKAVERGCDGE